MLGCYKTYRSDVGFIKASILNSLHVLMLNRFQLAAALLFFFMSCGYSTYANITVPSFYTSNMVLQRDKAINLYGWATPGEKIKVKLAGKEATTTANVSGQWKITLPSFPAGGPYQLEFAGRNKIVLNDVLMGDVWFCSGQSNMVWKLSWLAREKENIEQFSNTNIRIITIPDAITSVKETNTKPTSWKTFTRENVLDFSAVAAHFGKLLQPEINVPVGLIVSAWGGTDIEMWMTEDAFQKSGKHQAVLKKLSEIGDADVFEKNSKLAAQKWEDTTNRFDPGILNNWNAKGMNDNDWKPVQLPSTLRDLGINEPGNVWFRKTISLTAADTVSGLLISLGSVGTNADVYFNGNKLAKPFSLSGNNLYNVPASSLFVGENTIAIKVLRRWGVGGFIGKPEQMFAATAARTISLADSWKYKIGFLDPNPSRGPNYFPTSLFNGMVHPLTSVPVKGVIWYQGENNTNRSAEYAWNLQSLIKDWRRYWNDPQLPFLVVQLPNYIDEDTAKHYWKNMRAAQQEATSFPAVGLVVTYDIGDSTNVHPVNKYDVGKRLSLLARKMVYGQNNLVAEGPKVSKVYAQGELLVVQFDVTQKEEQLVAVDKYGYVKGFELAGADKHFYPATAEMAGDKIMLSARQVSKPVSVRYAWAENPDANLFNVAGLPAAPFVADIRNGN